MSGTVEVIEVEARCQCPGDGEAGRRIPVRVASAFIEWLRMRAWLGDAPGGINPNMIVATYRCTRCKATVVLTARALRLAD